jgi:hypothetical protein
LLTVLRVRAEHNSDGRRVGQARARRVDVFFFKTVPYPFHTRVRLGYTGTGMGYSDTGTGTGTRVFFLLFRIHGHRFMGPAGDLM